MAQDDLYEAARELLDAAAAAAATTPGGAPGTRYVSSGPPAFDCCDLLTVHLARFMPIAMQEAGRQNMPLQKPAVPMVQMVVTISRCYPKVDGGVVITIPLAQDMEKASFGLYADAWTIWNHLRTMARQQLLFASRPCRPVEFAPMTPTPTQGGCAGWVLGVDVEVDGYEPDV